MVNPKAVMDVDMLTRWADMPTWTIREACALSVNLDPAGHMAGYYGIGPERVPSSGSGAAAWQREQLCIRAASSGDLHLLDGWERLLVGGTQSHSARVLPAEFIAWARSKATFNDNSGIPLDLWAGIVAKQNSHSARDATSTAESVGPHDVLALRDRFLQVDEAVAAIGKCTDRPERDAAAMLLHMMEAGDPRLQSLALWGVTDGESIPLKMDYQTPARTACLGERIQELRSGVAGDPRRLVYGWMQEDFLAWASRRGFDGSSLAQAIAATRLSPQRLKLKSAREVMEEVDGISDARVLLAERDALRARVAELEAAASNSQPSAWPWGGHDTKLLRHIAAAAERFWSRYDPTDPTTAPTNAAIESWLEGQGVSHRNAQVIATILRADGLPTGPRK